MHAEPIVSAVRKTIATFKTIPELAERVRLRGRGVFHVQSNRDAVANLLREKGCVCIVASAKNPKLHAKYVYDFVGEVGAGEADYERRWGRLYTVQLV